MVWLPDGEKNEDRPMFIRFDRIHESGRQTDGRTERQTDTAYGIGRACIASRGKNSLRSMILCILLRALITTT